MHCSLSSIIKASAYETVFRLAETSHYVYLYQNLTCWFVILVFVN